MSVDLGFGCSCCGQRHEQLPFAYGALAPAHWQESYAERAESVLGDELCVIGGEHFFVRARLLLPVADADAEFEWGVWVSLSGPNFERMTELWTDPKRAAEPPSFGWLSTELSLYEPETLNLKTMVHSQPVGIRPTVELEPTDHPLAVEQRMGITLARVRDIAERLLHPGRPST